MNKDNIESQRERIALQYVELLVTAYIPKLKPVITAYKSNSGCNAE
jgi:hypothetical protein